jgi:hypothetical protein
MTNTPTEPQARENLLRYVNAWCEATGNKPISAGRYAHSDPNFFTDLASRHKRWLKDGKPDRVETDRKGSFTFRVYDRLVNWFENPANWNGKFPDKLPKLNDLGHYEKRKRNGSEIPADKIIHDF